MSSLWTFNYSEHLLKTHPFLPAMFRASCILLKTVLRIDSVDQVLLERELTKY